MLEEKHSIGLTMNTAFRDKSIPAFHFVLAALLIGFSPWKLSSQVDRTSMTGTIEDSSGRRVPGVSISVTHLSTGLSRTSVSDAQGAYTIANLPAGLYRMTIRKSGFQELTYASVEQAVGATRTLNPT